MGRSRRRRAIVAWLLGLLAAAPVSADMVGTARMAGALHTPPPGATVEVFFSPTGHSDRALATAIAGARNHVWLAGYYFTSSVLARALHQAHARGVQVRVLLDASQRTQPYSSARYFHNQGVPLWINARYPVMHHKFVVIDDHTLGLGSMNFTRAGAQHNADNFNLFRRWPELTQSYATEFERLRRESEPYAPGMPPQDALRGGGAGKR